ncbi:hypothetical protein YC2023_079099 [Brassica napus]
MRFCLSLLNLPNAMNAAEITDKLGLHSLRQRHWFAKKTPHTCVDANCVVCS